MSKNTLPTLLDLARPSLNDVAAWVGVSRGLANFWREGKSVPTPAKRAVLVRAMRKHARRLLKLADLVEAEGIVQSARSEQDAASNVEESA